MKKIICLILCVLLALTGFSCSGKKEGSSGPVKTGEYLLKDGKSEYVVVLPTNATSDERLAVDEFVTLFSEATGVTLPVITDENVNYTADSKYISIGNTKLVMDSGVEYSSEVKGINGFAIKTVDKSLFCIGGTEYGINFCVYDLLYKLVNFEQFYSDVYTIDQAVTDIELLKYDIEDHPDVKRVLGTAGYISSSPRAALRMRCPYNYQNFYASYNNVINGVTYGISFAHNSVKFLPPDVHYDEHPDWFMASKEQLCYTAHGNESEYQAMLDEFASVLKKAIKDNPTRHFFVMGDTDSFAWCTCTTCKNALAKYGTHAGGSLIFYNNLYDIIMDWFSNDEEGKQYYSPEFRMSFPAYYNTELPPVIKDDATGKYVPVDDKVVPRPGIVIGISPRFANYTKPFTHDLNKESYEVIKGWEAISNETYYWVYDTNYAHYIYPLDTFNALPDNAKVYANSDCVLINIQTQNGNVMGMTGWHVLKVYLSSNFMWNKNSDLNQLIDRFFNAMYGAGAEAMKEFFFSWREYSLYQLDTLKMGGSFVTRDDSVGTKKFWSKSLFDKWQGLVQKAIDDIEYLKGSNPAQYDILYRNIVMERVFLDYGLVDLYKVELGSKLPQYQRNLLEGLSLAQITAMHEDAVTSDLIKSLTEALGGRV